MEKVRIDKWLWSVRLFKTRSQATDACKAGKIKINDKLIKASALLKVDDIVEVKKNGYTFIYKSLKLIAKRVGAPIAVTCYQDLTPQEELDKYKSWFVKEGAAEIRDKGVGRPTKKERRKLDEFKDWD